MINPKVPQPIEQTQSLEQVIEHFMTLYNRNSKEGIDFLEHLMRQNARMENSTEIAIEAIVNILKTSKQIESKLTPEDLGDQKMFIVKGVKGDKGDKGAQGDKGDTGEKGDRGQQGIQGTIGNEGKAGKDGNPGKNGEDGEPGIQGEKGEPGKDGKDAKAPSTVDVLKKIREKLKFSDLKDADDVVASIRRIISSRDYDLKELKDVDVDGVQAGDVLTFDGEKWVPGTAGGAAGTWVNNEVVAGSDTGWTLAHVPIAGSVLLYANGQRLTLSVDYTISGAAITTVLSWVAGTIIADYRM